MAARGLALEHAARETVGLLAPDNKWRFRRVFSSAIADQSSWSPYLSPEGFFGG